MTDRKLTIARPQALANDPAAPPGERSNALDAMKAIESRAPREPAPTENVSEATNTLELLAAESLFEAIARREARKTPATRIIEKAQAVRRAQVSASAIAAFVATSTALGKMP